MTCLKLPCQLVAFFEPLPVVRGKLQEFWWKYLILADDFGCVVVSDLSFFLMEERDQEFVSPIPSYSPTPHTHPPPHSLPSPTVQKSAAACHCHSDLIGPEPKWHLIRLWISMAPLLNWLDSSNCKIRQGTPMGQPEAMLPPLKHFMIFEIHFSVHRHHTWKDVWMSSYNRTFPVRHKHSLSHFAWDLSGTSAAVTGGEQWKRARWCGSDTVSVFYPLVQYFLTLAYLMADYVWCILDVSFPSVRHSSSDTSLCLLQRRASKTCWDNQPMSEQRHGL